MKAALTASAFLLGATIAYSWALFRTVEFYPWLHQFLSTLVAASLAFTSGLAVYYMQEYRREKRLHDLLDSYLDYVLDQVRPSTEIDQVKIKFVNSRILNEAVNSGDFLDMLPRLIVLQTLVDRYVGFAEETMTRVHQTNAEVKPWERQTINRTATLIHDEAHRCKKLLHGEATMGDGIEFIEPSVEARSDDSSA